MAEHDHSAIKEHMAVIGADGVHVGTVDHVDGERIKLTKADSPQAEDGEGARHHYLPAGLVAVQTVGGPDGTLVLDARLAGLAVAAVALLLRAPFLLVIVLAAATAGLLRAFGWAA